MYCWASSLEWESSWGKGKSTVWAVRREGKAKVRNNLWAPRWEKQEKGGEGQQVPEQKFPAAPEEGLPWRTAARGRAHNGAGSSVRRRRREEKCCSLTTTLHTPFLFSAWASPELGIRDTSWAWQREVRWTCFSLLPHTLRRTWGLFLSSFMRFLYIRSVACAGTTNQGLCPQA